MPRKGSIPCLPIRIMSVWRYEQLPESHRGIRALEQILLFPEHRSRRYRIKEVGYKRVYMYFQNLKMRAYLPQ